MSDHPTVEERYASAIGRGAGRDILLAAGLQQHAVGVTFLRLRAEYDQARADLERAGQIAPANAERVKEMRREAARLASAAGHADWPHSEDLRRQAEALILEANAVQRRAPNDIIAARSLIYLRVTTFGDAAHKLGEMAVRMGAKPNRNIGAKDCMNLAVRVLDVWLDEVCHKCDGTGRLGNRYQGDAERECPTCKGTGHRRDSVGATLAHRLFARDLLAEVQRHAAAAAHGIKEALRSDAQARPVHPELARRLAELRGEQAAAD